MATSREKAAASRRVEFGFERTVCSCEQCARNCRFIPGYLIPSDLSRIIPPDRPLKEWAAEHLRASPGALVAAAGRLYRIPTIVPARKEDGSCVFLSQGLCAIHAVAPFGCAFFDNHMPDEEANSKSSVGLVEILRDIQGHYGQIWRDLWEQDLRVPGPEQSREQMACSASI